MIPTGHDVVKAANQSVVLCFCLQGVNKWEIEKAKHQFLPTFEVEYISASFVYKEPIWLSWFYADILNLENAKCIELQNDDAGTISTPSNEAIDLQNKYIDLKYHFARDFHFAERVSLCKWPTSDQNTDIRTKSLHQVKFEYLRSKIGEVERYSAHLVWGKCWMKFSNMKNEITKKIP